MKCRICSRQAQENRYCSKHLEAYQNILEKFRVWQRASMVSWCQYLDDIQKNSLTGEWAKEVAKHLIGEEKEDVKKN